MSTVGLETSLLDRTRPLPTEALIELNDVFGRVDGPRALDDVDAAIESQVGNKGVFTDRQFQIDAWPDACTYLSGHIFDVRQEQIATLGRQLLSLGYDSAVPITAELVREVGRVDSKIAQRALSVMSVVEIVDNSAFRLQKERGKNGSEFYVAVTAGNLIYNAQKRYLLDLLRDGRVTELHVVRNEDNGGLWVDGEQFRSSKVANARSIPGSRELVEDLTVEEQDAPLEVVWVDKFGNVKLRARNPAAYDRLFVPGQKAVLTVEGKSTIVVVGSNLDDSDTNQPTIYKEPGAINPRYVDLAIKVENCLSGSGHALAYLRELIGYEIELKDLRKLALDLEAA